MALPLTVLGTFEPEIGFSPGRVPWDIASLQVGAYPDNRGVYLVAVRRHCTTPGPLLFCCCTQGISKPVPPSFPSSQLLAGAGMNVCLSYKHVESQESVATEVVHRLDKLGRLLKTYEPDLIQLHGVFSRNHRTAEQSLSLTISLPTGTLHATGSGKNALAGCKNAFREIEGQIKKHQSLLRREHQWKRKRPPQEF